MDRTTIGQESETAAPAAATAGKKDSEIKRLLRRIAAQQSTIDELVQKEGIDVNVFLEMALRDLLNVSPGLTGAAIIGPDGLIIANELARYIEEDRLAAMAASVAALGEQTTDALNYGRIRRISIEGEKGYMVIVNVGRAYLVTTVHRDTKLGLVFLQMSKTAQEIAPLL